MGNEQAQRRELWRQRIGDCKQHGLAEHAFYSWRKQLRTTSPTTLAPLAGALGYPPERLVPV